MNSCSLCPQNFEFSSKLGHRVLEHVGAHVLYDPTISREDEPCGLCFRPSSICRIFLARALGGKLKIHAGRSAGCGNSQTFRYGVAAESTPTNLCSNVPVLCPICPEKTSPAVWKYNLRAHISSKHLTASLTRYAHLWEITKFEQGQMLSFWRERLIPVVRRTSKADNNSLKFVISEAHTSTIALASVDNDKNADLNLALANLEADEDEHRITAESTAIVYLICFFGLLQNNVLISLFIQGGA